MSKWKPKRRDFVIAHLIDALLLLASPRTRDVLREGMYTAIVRASEPERPFISLDEL